MKRRRQGMGNLAHFERKGTLFIMDNNTIIIFISNRPRKPTGHNPLIQNPRQGVLNQLVMSEGNLAFKSAMCDSAGFIRPCH